MLYSPLIYYYRDIRIDINPFGIPHELFVVYYILTGILALVVGMAFVGKILSDPSCQDAIMLHITLVFLFSLMAWIILYIFAGIFIPVLGFLMLVAGVILLAHKISKIDGDEVIARRKERAKCAKR